MHLLKLNETLDTWIDLLQSAEFAMLVKKPGIEGWSLGQVYVHLVLETNYYIKQIEYCLEHHDNCTEQMSANAIVIFANGELPDERVKNDSPSSQNMPQPPGKEQLLEQMLILKARLNQQWDKITTAVSSGTTQHPGLGYFNAMEWFQFAQFHLKHHLKQKERIEKALTSQ